MTQVNFNEYNKEKIKELPDTFKALVIDLEVVKAVTVYGEEKTKNPETDELIMIQVQNAEHNFTKKVHYPFYKPEEVPERSSLGKFLAKYRTLDLSMGVEMKRNDDGYHEVNLK